jgi:hypothetical protein
VSEADLKAKWRRHALKHGIWTRSLSPHQIPGLPDIVAVDCAASDVVRELSRTRTHWIEAKVAHAGPAAFRASRDATAPQVTWIQTVGQLGGSAWWLVLGEKRWLLVPWDRLEVGREEFDRKARKYGAAPQELFEPEAERAKELDGAAKRIDKLRLHVAELFAGRGKSK